MTTVLPIPQRGVVAFTLTDKCVYIVCSKIHKFYLLDYILKYLQFHGFLTKYNVVSSLEVKHSRIDSHKSQFMLVLFFGGFSLDVLENIITESCEGISDGRVDRRIKTDRIT